MLRYNLTMVALAGMAMAATLPRYQADAQSGQSLVFAEHACLEYKVPPHTAVFESCVERAARAFDRGQPDLAWTQARLTRDAGQACRADGDASDKRDYVRCVSAELDRRTKR
jgi:hypothetical protein